MKLRKEFRHGKKPAQRKDEGPLPIRTSKGENNAYNRTKEGVMGKMIPITSDISLLHPDEIGRWVGERLAEHRLAANLTREMLARRAGVSAETIKVVETRGRSSLATLARLLAALGLQSRLQALFTLEPAKSIAELELREAAPMRKRARRKTS